MQSHPEVSSFFLETTYYVLVFPFLVTQFSALLHPIFSHLHTNSSTNPPWSAKTWDYWPQWWMKSTTSIWLAQPVCWKKRFLSPLWLPFSYVSMATKLFLPVPQNAIYGYALNQPNACRGSDLFPCHCYRAGPVLSQTELLPGLCAGSHCLSLLCVCSRMCISYTLPYGSICYSHM